MGAADSGDNNEPTSNAAGQAQFITNSLCVFKNLGITNYTNYGLYDALTWWEHYQGALATGLPWGGFWGLISEYNETNPQKPAWTTMVNYNQTSSLSCPSPAPPVVAVMPFAPYYVENDQVQILTAAADASGLTFSNEDSLKLQLITNPKLQTAYWFLCGPPSQPPKQDDNPAPGQEVSGGPSPGAVPASCASTNLLAPSTTGSVWVQLSGTNADVDGALGTSPASASASSSFTVNTSPEVTGVVDYNSTAQQCNFADQPGLHHNRHSDGHR
jgi:hypothetical protein